MAFLPSPCYRTHRYLQNAYNCTDTYKYASVCAYVYAYFLYTHTPKKINKQGLDTDPEKMSTLILLLISLGAPVDSAGGPPQVFLVMYLDSYVRVLYVGVYIYLCTFLSRRGARCSCLV